MNKSYLLLLVFLSGLLNAKQPEQTLRVGIAKFPPYSYINDKGEPKGLEVDILKKCFASSLYKLEFIEYPYGRLPIALHTKDIDAHIVTLPNKNKPNLFYSNLVAPEYRAVAISLAKNNYKLESIADLYGKTVVAHQKAKKYYGVEYESIANKNGKKYEEYADQLHQIKLLYSNLADVIIIGENIFTHLKAKSNFPTQQNIKISPILGAKRGYHNVFHSEQARDYFNQCLHKIKANGVYQQLLSKNLRQSTN